MLYGKTRADSIQKCNRCNLWRSSKGWQADAVLVGLPEDSGLVVARVVGEIGVKWPT
jgi:hypothetical protein